MAFATLIIQPQHLAIGDLRNKLDVADRRLAMRGWQDLINAAIGGHRACHVRAVLASAVASQTVTVARASAVEGTDNITIGGSAGGTLNVEAAPATEDDFLLGATDIAFAANLAAAINAHSAISKLVWAVSDGVNTVTIYSVMPGPVGNLITLAETGNGFTLGAAALASGASDEVDAYELGYDPAL